ncbi:Rab-GTPase-TBC_domain-containing protein [Hexamita inflata]|uniref:Rab-GTPase-TBC domain-containing protein n=1 Tax=Hexamita inflata TaxID=28002 RepID=A0AA86RA29_9EUKA|nr:Rab-GTPase-TBC domain-containing protein [Hexamita inflata]
MLSIDNLQKLGIKQKLPSFPKRAHSLTWMILTETIKPKTCEFEDIEYELSKHRLLFKQLYLDYQQVGPFLQDSNDIIVKDVRRLDPDMVNSVQFHAVYPGLSPEGFRSAVLLLLRMIVRYELTKRQTLLFNVEYLQGMHELVAFILYSFVNQLSTFTYQELNQTKGCITSRFEHVMADAYAFSCKIIVNLLPVYLNHTALQDLCDTCQVYINQIDSNFTLKIKQEQALPPFITFVQKSVKLLFVRDFLYEKLPGVWDVLFSISSLDTQHWYGYICFSLAQLYYWRYLNMDQLKLMYVFQVFLEQNLMFPGGFDVEGFLKITIKNYLLIQNIEVEEEVDEKSNKKSSMEEQDQIEQYKQIQLENKTIVGQLNKLLDEINSPQVDDKVIAITTAQRIKYLVEGHIFVTDVTDGKETSSVYQDIFSFSDLLGEQRRVERMYNLME